MVFMPELVALLDNLERKLNTGQVSEQSRQWLAQCGLTPEQMKKQMEPEYVPVRKIHLYHCDRRGLLLALTDVIAHEFILVVLIRRKKSPYFRTSSFSNMAVRGGLTRFARPDGQPTHCVRGLSNWLRQLSNPGRGFSSPRRVQYTKKKPVLSYELFLKYGGEGGIDSLRSP